MLCRIAEEEGVFFIPDSVIDCFEESGENCPHVTRYHPKLECSDNLHLNGMGYGVMAERFAGYLVNWGLGEYVVDPDMLEQNLPTNLSHVEASMIELGNRNHPCPEEVNDAYEMVEFLHEKGFLYTTNWILGEKVLPRVGPVLENWDEIQGMFAQASECIGTLERDGNTRDATMSKAFISKAEKYWAECDYEGTQKELSKIVEKCPVPEVSIFGLFLLVFLFRGERNKEPLG